MDYQDPKPSRQGRQKRLDRRWTDRLLSRQQKRVEATGQKRRQERLQQANALPQQERMTARLGWKENYFSCSGHPIRQFLVEQVGRPWDQVYAEWCCRISKTEYRNNRPLRTMIWHYLISRVYRGQDGIFYRHISNRYRGDQPLAEGDLFIDPKTKILRRNVPRKPLKKKRRKRKNQDTSLFTHPTVKTRDQRLVLNQCYDLRIGKRMGKAEIRAVLMANKPHPHLPGRSLEFRYRKGVLPNWFQLDDGHGDATFTVALFNDDRFNITWDRPQYQGYIGRRTTLEVLAVATFLL